nr:sigma-70 family RNA polymerase sigma factor [Variovorax terrae]
MPAAYNLARWLCRNEQDSHDLVQESVLRAFRFFDSFRGDNARAWLLAIVRNTFYTIQREARPHAADLGFDEELHDPSATLFADEGLDLNPEALLARKDLRERVNEALRQLPCAFREVVVLKEIEGLSYKEIAAIAGIPLGTVMSRLARGRKLLAASLGPGSTGATSDAMPRHPGAAERLH